MVRPPASICTYDALPALLRQNFGLFLRFAFRELLGSRPFKPVWHVEAIEHQLDRMRDGEINQLIVTIPPRHLKSITITVAFVAWMLGREPASHFTCASYNIDLAEKHARDCLKIIESAWYKRAFPNVRLTKRSVLDFETSAGGGRLSTSVGGGVTGRGGGWVILDDPMKAEDALSETMREATINWFTNTLRSRVNDDQGRYILVMQRLHEDDLAGHLLRAGGWEELRLPAIATHDERVPLTRGRFYQRREGVVLSPEQFSRAYYDQRRAEDPYVFAGQYQQDPVGRIGAFVKPEWFKTYDEPPQSGLVTLSLDTAVKTSVRNDLSVGIVARWYRGKYYILDVWRDRVEFGDLVANVRRLSAQYNVRRLLIEDAASGQQLIQQLRNGMPDDPAVIGIKPIGEKNARFEAQASRIEAGWIVLPEAAPWRADFVQEVTRFPGGWHDDQADALAQLLANPPQELPTNAAPILVDVRDSRAWDWDRSVDPWAAA